MTPKMVLTLPLGRAPFKPGSGKSDTPCEQMHSENPSRDRRGLGPPEAATVLGASPTRRPRSRLRS